MSIVPKGKQVLCRLVCTSQREALTQTQVVRSRRRRSSVRGSNGCGVAPKTAARGPNLATALAPFVAATSKLHTAQVAQKLIHVYAEVRPKDLGQAHVTFINTWLSRYENNFSKHRRAGAAKRIFRHLWEEWGAPPLHTKIVKVTKPKPRNVTATKDERAKLIAAAPPSLCCWLLLCSDLAIRSGTAAVLGPSHYDRESGTLTFRTKYQNAQRMPVTSSLRKLLDLCLDPSLPFVSQLNRGPHWKSPARELRPSMKHIDYHTLIGTFGRLKRALGITRKLTPHDLRRTTARQVYALTGDLRTVQALLGHGDLNSTTWYLQDALIGVNLATLELAKLNPTTEVIQ